MGPTDEANARTSRTDWTTGPAKWFAVAMFGAASIGGIVWSMTARVPRADLGPARGPATDRQPAPAGMTAGDSQGAPAPAPRTRINLNTATPAELELLPGIGPALAARIVEYRDKGAGFKSVEELDRVKGIGPRILEKIRGVATVE